MMMMMGHYLDYGIQNVYDETLIYVIYAHARFDDLDLDARPPWVDKCKHLALHYLDN